MDNEKMQGIIERLQGIEEFAHDAREMLMHETTVLEPVKENVPKKEKVVTPAPADESEDVESFSED